MTSNPGEIETIFLFAPFGASIPLLPIHGLQINLLLTASSRAAPCSRISGKRYNEQATKTTSGKYIRREVSGLFGFFLWGFRAGFVCIFTQAWSIRTEIHWQTMVFTVLCLSQMGNVLALRLRERISFQAGYAIKQTIVWCISSHPSAAIGNDIYSSPQ